MGSAGKTILLVEDDAIIGLSESAMLRREGYEVIQAASGEAALATIRDSPGAVDLVLMDLNLGDGMDGTEAARAILDLKDLPVVFLSSHTEKEIVEKTEGVSGYGYIVKNSGPTVLFTSIKMAFRLHEAKTQLESSLEERRRMEEALEKRLVALTSPLDPGTAKLSFDDLFNRRDFQALQDALSKATGVASVLLDEDNTSLTEPSGFCRLCRDFVRPSPEGQAHCFRSDRTRSTDTLDAPTPCLSAGLWDGGTTITAGNRVVARWLVGQVLPADADLDALSAYASVVGADPIEYRKALEEVPRMEAGKFQAICHLLSLVGQQLSNLAVQNIQQARYIAESRASERVLKESEASLRRAEAAAGIGFWYLDLAPNVLTASDGALRLYGLDRAKDSFERFKSVPLREYRPLLDQALKDLLEGVRPYNVEFRIKRQSDGALRDIHSVAQYDKAEGRVFGIIRDVTELRQETFKLVESEAHFRFLFQNSAVALLEEDFSGVKRRLDQLSELGIKDLPSHLESHPEEVLDLISRIKLLNMNNAYASLLGAKLDSSGIGRSITNLPTVDPKRLLREFQALAAGATEFQDDLVVHRQGQEALALQLRLVIPREHRADWSRVFLSFVDLTKERAQEQRLEGLLKDKEVLMKELEHRVKNSMALISSLFDLESERLPDPEVRQVFLDARARIETVSAIYDLLSRSKDAEWLDSASQIEELVHLIEETYVTRASGFSIWASVESCRIATRQAVSISLMVNELVTNALKYAYKAGKGGPITVEFRKVGADFLIAVSDRGKGMAPGTDLSKPGHLGFRLVDMLAQQHGGKVSIHSGDGLRVEVRIPAVILG